MNTAIIIIALGLYGDETATLRVPLRDAPTVRDPISLSLPTSLSVQRKTAEDLAHLTRGHSK